MVATLPAVGASAVQGVEEGDVVPAWVVWRAWRVARAAGVPCSGQAHGDVVSVRDDQDVSSGAAAVRRPSKRRRHGRVKRNGGRQGLTTAWPEPVFLLFPQGGAFDINVKYMLYNLLMCV